jgi:glycosyltransferase involved in cell wall biosynthesis
VRLNNLNNTQTNRVKILFIHQVGCRGGAGTMLANIISTIDKQVFEPIVVCPKGDGNEQLVAAGAEVRISPRPIYQFLHYTGYSPTIFNPYFIKHAFMMWRDHLFWENYIRDSGAKIVCLNAMTLAPMALSGRQAGAKVMCIVQETSVRGLFGIRTAWLYRILSSWMDAVIFISKFDKDKSKCKAPIVEVIPNWINFNKFNRYLSQETARCGINIPQTSKVILMMGGINELKGTLQLIEATAMLPDIDNLIVLIAGYSGPPDQTLLSNFQRIRAKLRLMLGFDYRQKVLQTIKEKKLSGRIHFVGMQADVAPLYAAADILVFPATRPHQARPVLEAGAMALPVVVPDFHQTHEFVKHGFNGIAYRNRNARSLSNELRKLLNDNKLAKFLGENNYYNTCKNHDEAINSTKLQRVIIQLSKK